MDCVYKKGPNARSNIKGTKLEVEDEKKISGIQEKCRQESIKVGRINERLTCHLGITWELQ